MVSLLCPARGGADTSGDNDGDRLILGFSFRCSPVNFPSVNGGVGGAFPRFLLWGYPLHPLGCP